MNPNLQYLRYVLRHKREVFKAGRKLGVSFWRLLVHDLSKFLPSEWGPYVAQFFGPYSIKSKSYSLEVGLAFAVACQRHYMRNPHHWQYWLHVPVKPLRRYGVHAAGGINGGPMVHAITPTGNVPMFQALRRDEFGGFGALIAAEELARELNQLPIPLKMPEDDAREMVADWIGASLANGGDPYKWYLENRNKIILHSDTRKFVETLLLPKSVTAGLQPVRNHLRA